MWHRNLAERINCWGEWQDAERDHPDRAHGAHWCVDAAEELHRLVQEAAEVICFATGDQEDRREADAKRVHRRHPRQNHQRKEERVGDLVLRAEKEHARHGDDHRSNDHAERTADRHPERNCAEANRGGDIEEKVPGVTLPVELRSHHPDHGDPEGEECRRQDRGGDPGLIHPAGAEQEDDRAHAKNREDEIKEEP